MRIVAGVATDVGRVREGNEDAFVVEPPLYAVADGMGGARAGEVASQLALSTIVEMRKAGTGSLEDEVREANRVIFARAGEDERYAGMGTTLTAVLASPEAIHLAHVGDSRAYLLRAGALRQLTRDHTLVDRMVTAGEITPDEAEVHPHRNVLLRALGTEPKVEVDADDIGLLEGDRVLLCSDGLTTMVTEDQILAILAATGGKPQDAADRLVRAANRAGGIDNITVIVLDIEAGDPDEGTVAAAPVAQVTAPKRRLWPWLVGAIAGVLAADGRVHRVPVLRRQPVVRRGLQRPRGDLPGHPRLAVRVRPVARRPGHGSGRGRGRAARDVPGPERRDQRGQPRRGAGDRRADAAGPPRRAEQARRRFDVSAIAAPAVKTRRPRTGLAAVLVAAGASVLAYALGAMGLSGERPDNLIVYGVAFTGFAVAGWYAIRRFARGADPVLYPTAVLLGGLGLAMLYRLMVDRGHPEFAAEQAVWLVIGLASFVVVLVVVRDVRQLDAYTYTIGLAGLILLLLPIVPGRRHRGQRREAVGESGLRRRSSRRRPGAS